MSDQNSVEQKINKESFIKILDFIYDYIDTNTEKEFNKIGKSRHKDFIVASLFLYFGNNILPLINNETSFSKGTYKGDMETYKRTKIEQWYLHRAGAWLGTRAGTGAYQTKLETALETARTFLTMGLSPAQVAQGTGLPMETIQELIDS